MRVGGAVRCGVGGEMWVVGHVVFGEGGLRVRESLLGRGLVEQCTIMQ